jgi:hypothetical protein
MCSSSLSLKPTLDPFCKRYKILHGNNRRNNGKYMHPIYEREGLCLVGYFDIQC